MKMDLYNIKHTVTAIILNDKNEVLGVSRKDDHNDFGLVGGKIESGESFVNAIKREVKEETGLTINIDTMTEILSMPRIMNGQSYWGHTYLIKDWYGMVVTEEPHIVKWTTFSELEEGSFGDWNTITKNCLEAVGVEIK